MRGRADRVDSLDATQLVTRFANVSATGVLGATRGAIAAAKTSEGIYAVRFETPIIPNWCLVSSGAGMRCFR